jgi:valyl-tRNA synthetase
MTLPKRYHPLEVERRLQAAWEDAGTYQFHPNATGKVYSIDTPPPTVSGDLHLGHVYSYTHPDLMARFFRMNGYNVYYPMGYDDNGLPTERYVERMHGVSAREAGRAAFIQACIEISANVEKNYEALWKRLGLSIDWRFTYRTIDEQSRRISQLSFIHFYQKDLAYRRQAPAIWCPECRTAIAQADLDELEIQGEYVTIPFEIDKGPDRPVLPIATTRPELLPACVAVFVNPTDDRYKKWIGEKAFTPLSGRKVPILPDQAVDPQKGSGAVMCCTFGDATDVAWQRAHCLPMIEIINPDGRFSTGAGELAGLTIIEGRHRVIEELKRKDLILNQEPVVHSVRVHERCDTPVEYLQTYQWFIRVLDFKDELLAAGEKVDWRPARMLSRYRVWVENLNWDWCISRQRIFGVPFPLWYCRDCGEMNLAEESQLPVDPLDDRPARPCRCGSVNFKPEEDVMDTWATSSLSPQIAGRCLEDSDLYEKVFPYSLRPQAQEIIRTWAFYTLVKSHFQFNASPWRNILISGWGIAGEGMEKISKSRGGGPLAPLEMLNAYSADAVRYWASGTGPGKDTVINIEKIETGSKLINKLWNVARFSERFVSGYHSSTDIPELSPADKWILSRTQSLIRQVTKYFHSYDYAAARNELEIFFWKDLADNYLEMGKQRLYDPTAPLHEGALYTLYQVMIVILKMFAPFFPYVTEEIYQGLFSKTDDPDDADQKGIDSSGPGFRSIHRSRWPQPISILDDKQAEVDGEILLGIATAARRFKSERNLSLGTPLDRLQLATGEPSFAERLKQACVDLASITRAEKIEIVERLDPTLTPLITHEWFTAAVQAGQKQEL